MTERRALHELGHGGDGTIETVWGGHLEGRETGGELEVKLLAKLIKPRRSGSLPLMPVSTLASVYQESILKSFVIMNANEKPRANNLSNERLSGVFEYKIPVQFDNLNMNIVHYTRGAG